MTDEMKIAILRKMVEQLQGVIEGLQAVKPPSMSNDTYRKMLLEMGAQLEALRWSHNTCADMLDGERIEIIQ